MDVLAVHDESPRCDDDRADEPRPRGGIGLGQTEYLQISAWLAPWAEPR